MAKQRSNKSRKHKKFIAANSNRAESFRGGFTKTGVNHNSNTKRDVWEVGGLPEHLEFSDFYNMYRRSGLARAGVLRHVERTWKTLPLITDGIDTNAKNEYKENDKKTQFEKEVDILINKHNLYQRLVGLDIRQRVGRYGGIIIVAKQLDKAAKPDDALECIGINSLVKIVPVFESQIDVTEDNDDITSVDFGNPKYYNYKSDAIGTRSRSSVSQTLHPSRVYAFGEGADDGTIYGVPCLEAGFNALSNWEKVSIASSEGHFKNAKQRIVLNINSTETAGANLATPDAVDDFSKNVEDFGAGWDSSLITSGIDVTALQSSVQDPTGPANIQLQEFVASIHTPKTILIGFETGERSSTENSKVYNETIGSRRSNVISDMITGFLNHLIDIGILTPPESGEIGVQWDDLLASSDADKLDNVNKMADINQKGYQSGLGQTFNTEELRKAAGFEESSDDLEDYDDMVDDDDQED